MSNLAMSLELHLPPRCLPYCQGSNCSCVISKLDMDLNDQKLKFQYIFSNVVSICMYPNPNPMDFGA